MMAGDKQFTHVGGLIMKGKTKIHEIPETSAIKLFNNKKVFVGFSGNADSFGDAIQYFYYPEGKAPRLKEVEMLLLNEKGEIYHGTNFRNWLRIDEPFFAIGSGMTFAMAAMKCGKDPYEAIKVASQYDANTGKGFNKLSMKESK